MNAEDPSTPLDPDEVAGLRLAWVATRADLNAAEQRNIATALATRRWTTRTTEQLLDDLAIRQLHKAMFGEVWRWAGRYRTTERNLGAAPEQISVAVRNLVADVTLWVSRTGASSTDEAATRFHHSLVSIHPFPNGNGRHARAMTDLLLSSLDQPVFTWGRTSLTEASTTRARYIAALRSADAGDFEPLADFVRS